MLADVVRAIWKLSQRVGLAPTAGAVLAWIAACGACAYWVPRWVLETLGPTREAYLPGVLVIGASAFVAAACGLVGFWLVAAHIDDRRRGYRVRWIAEERWAYEERVVASVGGAALTYRCEVRDLAGYPQPCTIHAPSEAEWEAGTPAWAHGRRAEILQRIRDRHGADRGGDVVLAAAPSTAASGPASDPDAQPPS